MSLDDDIERACNSVRQKSDKCHVERDEAVWLVTAGLSLDEQTRRFKAAQVYKAFVANGRNITTTADSLKIAFNTCKTHIRYYLRLSKDC